VPCQRAHVDVEGSMLGPVHTSMGEVHAGCDAVLLGAPALEASLWWLLMEGGEQNHNGIVDGHQARLATAEVAEAGLRNSSAHGLVARLGRHSGLSAASVVVSVGLYWRETGPVLRSPSSSRAAQAAKAGGLLAKARLAPAGFAGAQRRVALLRRRR
jgi:hypothetical protein